MSGHTPKQRWRFASGDNTGAAASDSIGSRDLDHA